MIAKQHSGITTSGNMTGQNIAMSIDQAAMAHIMSVLTDLYSDPELAVLREYSTNALDAHIEAGVNRPIDVILPSGLSPFLTIRDYGVGLSVEDIHNIYSKYGASTKRGTNDQVGMLGLGCKSALTYCSAFTLSSVKNGTAVTVNIGRDESGSGTMTVVDTAATDKPDGTEIVIPARRYNDFERKANNFFRFWQPGTVRVNGKEPAVIEGLEVGDTMKVVHGLDKDYVVMGNVAYPAQIDHGLPYRYKLVAWVPIGSVNFTPSREALHMTGDTKSTIARIGADLRAKMPAALQEKIEEAATPREAIQALVKWSELMPRGVRHQFQHKGRAIPMEFRAPAGKQFTVVHRHSGKLSRNSKMATVMPEAVVSALWFYGYDRPEFTAGQRKKIDHWIGQNFQHDEHTYYILVDDKPDATWIDPARILKWADVAAVKLPRAATTRSGRIPGSYDMYVGGDPKWGRPANDIDQKLPVFYAEGPMHHFRREANLLTRLHPGCTIVCMGANRIDKFRRSFPQAIRVRDAIDAAAKTWATKLTQDDKINMSMHDAGIFRNVTGIKPDRVDDPAIKDAVRRSKQDLTKLLEERKVYCALLGKSNSAWNVPVKNPMESYPLFSTHGIVYHPDHTYLYLNAVYNKEDN